MVYQEFLICNGYNSHITGDFIEHCIQNNIKLLILPPHSSYFTQPLDIGIFSLLKEYLLQVLSPIILANIATLHKAEWFKIFIKVRLKAFSKNNILGSWKEAGLELFNPKKVLRRIISVIPLPSLSSPIQIISTPRSTLRQAFGFNVDKV